MSNATDGINAIHDGMKKQHKITLYRNLSIVVMDILSSLVLPLIRRGFGERFLSVFWVAIMMTATFFASWYWQVSYTATVFYMVVLAIACFYHWFIIFRRNKRDEIWHTRYEGQSNFLALFQRLPRGRQMTWVEGLYEPLAVYLIAFLLSLFVDAGLGGIFAVSATCLAIRARIRYQIMRQTMLDDRDQMIESEGMLDALNGAPAEDNNGLVIMDAEFMKPSEKRAKAKQVLTPEAFNEHFPEPPKDFSDSVPTTH